MPRCPLAEDPVDKAIAGTQRVVSVDPRIVTIASTGRQFAFLLPPDVTDAEIFEVVGWLATHYRAEQIAKRKARDPAARLWVPPAAAPRSS